MTNERYRIIVEAGDDRAAGQGARSLSDDLREIKGVLEADREKGEQPTMDLGAIVTIIAASSATLAIAQGVADWIRRHRGTILKIERDPKADSIKVAIENIDPEAALRITETILRV